MNTHSLHNVFHDYNEDTSFHWLYNQTLDTGPTSVGVGM